MTRHNLGEEIYSGTASLGRIMAIVGAVFGSIIALGMIIVGIVILKYRSHMRSTSGVVLEESNCGKTTYYDDKNRAVSSTRCQTKVQYAVNGKIITGIAGGGFPYFKGDRITVYYDPATPNHPELDIGPKGLGWYLIGGALIVLLLVWVWVLITRKYKMAAAAGGAGAVLGVARGY